MVLFSRNLPQPTQAQLMRGESPETLCEPGVVLSCRFAEWTVRWTSRVLWMAVVSQSSENSSRQENRELPCRQQHTLPQLSPKSHQPLLHIVVPSAGLRIRWFGGNSVVVFLFFTKYTTYSSEGEKTTEYTITKQQGE